MGGRIMASILNADTSSGVVITSDTSGELKLQSGGTDIATVTSGGITMASGKTLPASALTGSLPALNASSLTDIPVPSALSTASGSAPSYSARAWVNFDGTGTVAIRNSGNVSSITDNGTGIYTVNFTTAMPDVDYSVGLAGGNSTSNTNVASLGGNAQAPNLLTTSVDIICSNIGGTVNDLPYITISIFR